MDNSSTKHLRLHSGFTLIEVMITVAIIAIVMNIGISGYSQLIDGAQKQKIADSLKASIAQARGESITHGGNVRFCGSDDGTTCTASFGDGWLSYYDEDIDLALGSTDTILNSHTIDYNGTTIVATDSAGTDTTEFGFNYRGYPLLPISLEISGRGEASTVQLHANGRVEHQ